MIKYVVFKNTTKKLWQKRYLWIVYTDKDGVYTSAWAWSHNGACNEAEFYIDRIQDGKYFK